MIMIEMGMGGCSYIVTGHQIQTETENTVRSEFTKKYQYRSIAKWTREEWQWDLVRE